MSQNKNHDKKYKPDSSPVKDGGRPARSKTPTGRKPTTSKPTSTSPSASRKTNAYSAKSTKDAKDNSSDLGSEGSVFKPGDDLSAFINAAIFAFNGTFVCKTADLHNYLLHGVYAAHMNDEISKFVDELYGQETVPMLDNEISVLLNSAVIKDQKAPWARYCSTGVLNFLYLVDQQARAAAASDKAYIAIMPKIPKFNNSFELFCASFYVPPFFMENRQGDEKWKKAIKHNFRFEQRMSILRSSLPQDVLQAIVLFRDGDMDALVKTINEVQPTRLEFTEFLKIYLSPATNHVSQDSMIQFVRSSPTEKTTSVVHKRLRELSSLKEGGCHWSDDQWQIAPTSMVLSHNLRRGMEQKLDMFHNGISLLYGEVSEMCYDFQNNIQDQSLFYMVPRGPSWVEPSTTTRSSASTTTRIRAVDNESKKIDELANALAKKEKQVDDLEKDVKSKAARLGLAETRVKELDSELSSLKSGTGKSKGERETEAEEIAREMKTANDGLLKTIDVYKEQNAKLETDAKEYQTNAGREILEWKRIADHYRDAKDLPNERVKDLEKKVLDEKDLIDKTEKEKKELLKAKTTAEKKALDYQKQASLAKTSEAKALSDNVVLLSRIESARQIIKAVKGRTLSNDAFAKLAELLREPEQTFEPLFGLTRSDTKKASNDKDSKGSGDDENDGGGDDGEEEEEEEVDEDASTQPTTPASQNSVPASAILKKGVSSNHWRRRQHRVKY